MPKAFKEELKEVLLQEREQFLQRLQDAVENAGWTEADKAEILGLARGVVDDGATPAEGHSVRLSYRTVGTESQFLNFGNDGASDETAGQQKDLHLAGLAAANSEVLKGPEVATNLSFSDNNAVETAKFTHLIQIAAYQSAIGGAVKQVADAQLAELRALPEE